jgi:DNA-binding NarL/FixJ family response regulator
LIKRLRIPKARQAELRAIMREPETSPQAPFSNVTFGELQLTPREKELLRLVINALSNREIARQLGVEERTVKTHLSRLMRKTGSENRIELVMLALSGSLATEDGTFRAERIAQKQIA